MERQKHVDALKIRISGLSNRLHEYHFSTAPSEIGLEHNFTDAVNVDAVLDKTPGQLYLKAKIRTSGQFSCDRCVEEFKLMINGWYAMFYVYDDLGVEKFETEEVRVINSDTVHIDITEDVRQMTILSVPLKLLCKEDCKGLCPECGTNRNVRSCACKGDYVDARWEGLEGLLNK